MTPKKTPNSPKPTPRKAAPKDRVYPCRACGTTKVRLGTAAELRCRPCENKKRRSRRKRRPEMEAENRRLRLERQRARDPIGYAASVRNRKRCPELARIKGANLKAWRIEGGVTCEERRWVRDRDNGQCVYCGIPVACRCQPMRPRGFDHVLAKSLGGRHEKSNLVVSCWPCNFKKAKDELRAATRKRMEAAALRARIAEIEKETT